MRREEADTIKEDLEGERDAEIQEEGMVEDLEEEAGADSEEVLAEEDEGTRGF